MITTETLYDGQVERIVLAHGKGNVLDAQLTRALTDHLAQLSRPELKLVVLDGGRHFSFGASVEEHLPGRCEAMLGGFHELFRTLERLGVPTAAVVRGACLGGGAELAMWCGRVFAAPNARMGLPEVTLGVFPPIGTLALAHRTRGPVATELVITGRVLECEEALDLGLADEFAADPDAAWRAWFEEHLQPRSAPAVRFAWRASRRRIDHALTHELPALERLYLDELMAHEDPVEGLSAFIERRQPAWRHA